MDNYCSPEPFLFEFPEFTGHARRDYWLSVVRELICAHQFIRKYQLEEFGKAEALSRAVLGIARLRATRELNHALPPKPEALLTFLTGEELHGGDLIMEAVARTLRSVDSPRTDGDACAGPNTSISNGKFVTHRLFAISAAATLISFGASKKPLSGEDAAFPVGEFLIGDLNPVERAVMNSRDNSKRMELAQSTIDGVKVDGIEMNIAVMKVIIIIFSSSLILFNSYVHLNIYFVSCTLIVLTEETIYSFVVSC